jgi:hypothetical protein
MLRRKYVLMLAVYYIDMWNMGIGILDFILKMLHKCFMFTTGMFPQLSLQIIFRGLEHKM